MQQKSSKLRSVVTWGAIVVAAYFALTWGRSWSNAQHEVPEAAADEVIWIATFNGL